jgi:GalNAc-alpha-(1->4)-GalNAc-alpha-(1->3)-diNAcBac-PP-undecaprenol alpha-1,4-N-acetyl-D-galactosaminyltransferase
MNKTLSPDIQSKSSRMSAHEALSDNAMRITLVISKLGAGGADRAMAAMGNYWVARRRDVTLITLARPHGDFYPLDRRIKRVGLGLMASLEGPIRPLRDNLQRLTHMRRAIRASQPDVIISFNAQQNALTLLASFGLGVPVIVREEVEPSRYSIGRAWEALRRLVYPQADAVVVVASALRAWAQGIVRKDAVHFIPNPVAVALKGADAPDKKQGPPHIMVAMGRLTHQKGFDLLLQAFSKCAHKHPDWSLVILGEGEERTKLESLAAELKLTAQVSFPGLVPDPVPVLCGADLFVMASRYEGLPLALLEAMACGLAVIYTDCPTGPGEVIRNGEDGVLVPTEDVDALAAAMDRLMGHRLERQRLASRAVHITERYGMEKVMDMWEALFTRIQCNKREQVHGRGYQSSAVSEPEPISRSPQ